MTVELVTVKGDILVLNPFRRHHLERSTRLWFVLGPLGWQVPIGSARVVPYTGVWLAGLHVGLVVWRACLHGVPGAK